MEKIQKEGKWVPYELNERQQKNRKITSEMVRKEVFCAANCDWKKKLDILRES